MKKRILSIVLTICMVLALLPMATIPASAATTAVTDEASLKSAVSAAADGDVVQLASDISLTTDGNYAPGITITNNNSFTLDLNGHKLAKTAGSYGVFLYKGGGKLTIDDSSAGKTGEISSTAAAPTIVVNVSTLTLTSGKISNNGGGNAISNNDNNISLGTINIVGGLLIGGIETYAGGTINVSGGKIQATRYGIRGYTTSGLATKINISGGEISSTNYTGIQADTCATIYIKGAAVIRGAGGAMNTVPETNPYDGWGIWASTNYDGSNPVSEFDPANINQYKYVEYVSPPITYEATISAYKNGSAWTDVANDKIVLSTSATNEANDHFTVTPAGGTFAYDNLAALPLYIWAKNNAGTYVKIGSLSFLNCDRTVNYYDITLTKGTGIESVAGDGTYLSGETASVSATLKNGYTWDKWSDDNTTLNRSITVSTKAALTANATLKAATAPTVNVTGAALSYGYSSGSVSVSATAPDGQTITGYQWYSNLTNSNTDGTLITGATSASYALATGKSIGTTEYYYCVVTSTRTDNSQTATATSGVATVTVGKADGSGSVSIDGWTYGSTAKSPVPVSTTNGTDHVSYSYEGTGSTSYPANTAAPTNSGTYKVTATFAATDTYKECTATGTFTIAKAPVSFKVSDNTHDYDAAAHTAIVTQAASETPSVAGCFTVAYQKDTEQEAEDEATVGVYKIIVTLTSDNFKFAGQEDTVRSLTLTDKLTINAVAYSGADSITLPTAGSLTYGAKLSDSTLTGGDTGCTYAWKTGTTIPTVVNTGYAVVCTPKDTNYTPFEKTVSITVSKAAPTLTLPGAGTITYGQKLSDSTLTGGSASAAYNGAANTEVPGAYSWSTGTTAPQVSDSNTTKYEVTFTPADTANYLTATGEITLKVNPRPVALTWDYTTPFTYDGTAKTVAAAVSNKVDEDDTFHLTFSNNSKTNAGSYTADVTALGNSNYTLDSGTDVSKEWDIAKAPISFTVSDNSYTYDTAAHKATVAQTASQTPVIATDKYTVTYKLPADGSATADKTDAGVYDVIVTLSDDNFCFAGESDPATRSHKTGTLAILQNTVTALWKNTTTVYDGTEKTPVLELVGLKTGDTAVKAQLKETKTDAGTYTVTAELTGANSGNYTLTNPTETFVIQKAPVSFTLTGNSVKKGETVNVIATPSVNGIDAVLTYWQNGKQVAAPTEAGSYDVYAEITNRNYRHGGGTDGTAQKIGVLIIYESNIPVAYTVSFDANGGTGGTASMDAAQAGTVRILPESGFTSTGKTFAGWQYSGKIYQPGQCFTQPSSNVALKALWNDKVYAIGGIVQEGDPVSSASNVVVTLMLGSRQIGQTVTGADGTYSFANVAPGVYNLVANKDGVTQTVMVTIEDKAVADQTITMPAGRLNSVVEVKAGSPAIVVGDLEKAFTAQDKTDAASKTVELKLTAEAKAADSANNAQQEIEKKAGSVDLYLDFTLTKTVDGTYGTLDSSPVLLTAVITLPAELQGKDDYNVYRYHGTEVQTLTTAPNNDGEKFEVSKDKTTLTVYTKNFSAYAIKGITNVTAGSGGGSGVLNCKLTFDVNGGSAITAISKTSGTTVALSAYTPVREGYTFAGWCSDAKLTKAVTSVKLTADTTIYAKWTEKGAMPFTDIPADAYYYDAVLWAVDKGITSGTTPATFNPGGICTRAQTVTFLWRAMGSPEPTAISCPFTDAAKDAYYYKAVLWATEKGITVGTSATTFSPDDTVTRGQTVTFLWRAAGNPEAAAANPFADVKANAYYADAVLWAVKESITSGTGTITFSPADGCTRAQIVTFLYRYLSK